MVTVQLGVDGKERGSERTLAEQAAEQVGNLEGEVERVHHRAGAEDAGQQRVPGEARDTADEGEHRKGASVAFESSTHGCARGGRRGYLVSDRCDAYRQPSPCLPSPLPHSGRRDAAPSRTACCSPTCHRFLAWFRATVPACANPKGESPRVSSRTRVRSVI